MRRLAIVIAWMLLLAVPAGVTARHPDHRGPLDFDYAKTALNIIPSGQFGSLPVPPGADRQALMYDGLTPLFDQVTPSDLTTYFKSERFGVDTSGPGTNEPVPRPGVTITRDTFNVPHVRATT